MLYKLIPIKLGFPFAFLGLGVHQLLILLEVEFLLKAYWMGYHLGWIQEKFKVYETFHLNLLPIN